MIAAPNVRNLLEEAAVFARAGDMTAAVARARDAVRASNDDASRDEATLALARFEAAERAWRSEIDARFERERTLDDM
jgi:hypothetical protein